MCSTGMNNYMMYVGSGGVYTHTVAYERDTSCPICSAGLPIEMHPSATLQQLIGALMADTEIGPRLSAPSISCGTQNLYMRGALEGMTRENLSKPLSELVDSSCCILNVNDKKLPATMRVRLRLKDAMDSTAG
mmetsp:Transcript_17998/g.50362  ORF Transcript_17998/g.50362 Transcript_17998/m.50362 type:complete len:133 (+) Transcript_17998:181-579(+)